jgi:anti-sigma B factor antagonist
MALRRVPPDGPGSTVTSADAAPDGARQRQEECPDMDLSLDVTERNGYTVLAVHGEVDVYTAPRLRERLVELVSQGKNQIVVDLEGVDFLDSTGLGVLVGGLKRLRSHDGDLTLVCTQQRILKVFEITGLTKVFAIHDSVDAATAG